MAISKKQREVVFNKYGGKCAYCGCALEKGWHVDHVEPCRRITETEMVRQPEGVYPIARYLNSLNMRMVQYKMVKKYRLVEETGNPVVFYFETRENSTDAKV